jgi:hypothetical protein
MRLTRLALTAAALAAVIPALGAGNALAADRTTFNYTGSEQTYTVPANTYFLRVSAIGASGGNSSHAGGVWLGGHGGTADATLPVTPGQTLHVYVGGAGRGGRNEPGGFNGGGASANVFNGSSGGGASDIRTVAGDLASRLVVAGGGGGAGFGPGTVVATARGGDGGYPNGESAPDTSDGNSGGGGGGTQSSGGAGGWARFGTAGQAGSFGQGGTAGQFAGAGAGAGGGGYYGGGGGGEEGGGGGGSSYAAPQAIDASFDINSAGDAPSITVTPLGLDANQSTVTFAQTPQQTLSAGQDVTFTNDTPVNITIGKPLRFDGADEDDFFATRNYCDGAVLIPGTSCSVKVKFSPSATGARSATLTMPAYLTNGGDDASVTVALAGTGGDLPQGPQGPQGPDGPTGPTGPTGSTGPQGTQGADGPTGPTGPTGPQGTQGDKGNTGDQGPQGDKGDAGTNGRDGDTGRDGSKGDRGPRGRSGATKLGSRAACKVTRLGAGSRVVCTFKKRLSRRAKVTLRDRRGQLSAGFGNGSRQLLFVTGRPVRGKLNVWVVLNRPDVVYHVTRH